MSCNNVDCEAPFELAETVWLDDLSAVGRTYSITLKELYDLANSECFWSWQ